MSQRRAAPVLVLITICSLALLGTGFWAGRMLTLGPLRRQIATWGRAESIGDVLNAADRAAIAPAYLDAERARHDDAGYSWMPPNRMAPFVGHILASGQTANATINLLGCRGKQELLPSKVPGTLRVLMTGGSVLYGSGAPSDAATIAALLQTELGRDPRLSGKPLEVFAFAVPGWNTTHERIAVENLLCDLAPDLVVSFSGMNDVLWAEHHKNVLWMRSYSDQHWFDLLGAVLRLCDKPPPTDLLLDEPAPPSPGVVAERLFRNVDQVAHLLERLRVPYVFVLQPAVQVTKKALTPREHTWFESEKPVPGYRAACVAAIRTRLLEKGATNLRFVDTTDTFDTLGADVEVFVDSVHFGDRGNSLVAKRLAQPLADALSAR